MKSFKKSITLLFLFMIVGIGNLWADETVGATDNSTTYGGAFSTEYTIGSGQKLHLEFTNYSDKNADDHNWLLYLLDISGLTTDAFVLQASNYWYWGSNNSYNSPFTGDLAGKVTAFTCAYDWTNFRNDMDGAFVTMDINHTGWNVIVRTVATNNGRTYTLLLKLTNNSETNPNIRAKLSVNQSHLVISKAETSTSTLSYASYDFTGSGEDVSAMVSSGTTTVGSNTVKVLDFTNQTYGNKTFEHGSDRFAVDNGDAIDGSSNKWYLKDGGLYAYWNGNKNFYILDLDNGDRVTVNYIPWTDAEECKIASSNANVASNTTLVSGTEYTMTDAGALTLSIGKLNQIKSITVEHETPSVTFTSNGTTATSLGVTAQLIMRDFNSSLGTAGHRPIINVVPSSATVHYSSSNEKIAKVSADGTVMFRNTGVVTITASINNNTYATYTVTVEAADATAEITNYNQTYTVTGEGKLGERVVTGVTGMVMEFGSMTSDANKRNTTIVRNENNTMVASTLDENGWRHLWYDGEHDLGNGNKSVTPYQGSFYTFIPTANGKLTVSGLMDNQNSVDLVDATSGYTKVQVFDTSSAATTSLLTSSQINLIAGHTYYLYGNIPSSGGTNTGDTGWGCFKLHSFTYATDFKLTTNHGVTAANATSWTSDAIVEGASMTSGETTIEIVANEGGVNNATASLIADGTKYKISVTDIAFTSASNQGGAIVMKITSTTGSDYFTLTIPYGLHTWYFTKVTNENVSEFPVTLADMKNSSRGLSEESWSRTYEMRTKTNGRWTYLNNPVVATNAKVDGDNARYISATAGLLFTTTGAQKFGTSELGNNAITSSSTLDEQFDAPFSATSGVTNIACDGGTTLKIPQVPAGSFIRIWWHPHSATSVTCSNLTDLAGTSITGSVGFTGSNTYNEVNSNQYKALGGNIIFRAASSGDVSLTMASSVWNRIFKIEVSDKYSTDLNLHRKNNGLYGTDVVSDGRTTHVSDNYLVNDYIGLVYKAKSDNSNVDAHVRFDGSMTNSQAAYTPTYTVTPASSSDNVVYTTETQEWQSNGATYRDLIINVQNGTGLLKITQDILSNGYVIDRSETWYPVGNYHQQTYPCTWDFTAHNMSEPFASGQPHAGQNTAMTNVASTTDNTFGDWNNGKVVAYSKEAYTTAQLNNTNIVKPLRANRSELTYGRTTLEETKGLRFTLPASGDWSATANSITDDYAYNQIVGIDGAKLAIAAPASGKNTTITIPNVSAGQYVFVKASAEPTATLGSTALTKITANHFGSYAWDALNDVYAYYISEAGDVNLTFSSADVYKIGVTDVFKIIKNSAGKTTESRNVAIDYAESGTFTANALQPYIATTYTDANSDYGTIALVAKNCIPANTGVLLYNQNPATDKSNRQIPLFVPASNVSAESVEGNKLVANVTSATVDGSTSDVYRYVFTNKFSYTYNNTQRTGDYGFYKVNSSGTLAANMAYLQLNKSSDGISYAKQVVLFDFDSSDSETTAIENIGYEKPEDDVKVDVWYSLDGRRINGRPSVKGIYINQGRKVVIK